MSVERLLLIYACRPVMLNICAKFHEIIFNGIKAIEWTHFYRKITKGNNSAKNSGGATVVNVCMLSVMLYISTKFCEIILNSIKVIERTRFLY